MEVLKPRIPSSPQIFSPKFPFTTRRKKNSIRFNTHHSKFLPCPPFSTCLQLTTARNFRISAHFGRPSNRRNSLRKKLTEQQVRHNPIIYTPSSDFQNNNLDSFLSNSDNDSVKQNDFNSNFGVVEDIVESDSFNESKSKILGESVLWNKLEGWVDQYKKDSEFWGIGFGPIFTIFQDSDGNVKRVVVNEDEIFRRSRIEPSLHNQSEFEDLTEVNSKISHAKNLAREIERGDYTLSKNSSVAKFVVGGGKSGFVNAIRGITLQPGSFSKLSRVGIMVMCGFFVFWAMKTMFSGGKDKAEYTRLEKEMIRRKIKARTEKEKLQKGCVEVIPDSTEPQMVSTERPLLDKQELMNTISKAKASSDKLALQQSSSTHVTNSMDFNNKIQEIRAMARHAREIEKRDASQGDSDREDDQTVNELSTEKELVKEHQEGIVSFLDDLSNGYSGQTRGLNDDSTSDDTGFSSEVALVGNSDTQTSDASSEKVSNDSESIEEVVKDSESGLNSQVTVEVSQSSDTPNSQSFKSRKKSIRTKPRVIRSVKEAREFLSKKCDKQEPNQEPQVRTVQEGAAILGLQSEKETGGNTSQRLYKDNKMFDPSILGGTSDSTPATNAFEDSTLERKESVPTINNNPEATGEGYGVTGFQIPRDLSHEGIGSITETGPSVLMLPRERETETNASQEPDKDIKMFQPSMFGGSSDSTSAAIASGDFTLKTRASVPTKNSDPKDVEEGYGVVDYEKPGTSSDHEINGRSTELVPLVNKENWMEKNFHEFDPVVKKIGLGFRDNYMVAREKFKQELNLNTEMIQPRSDEDDSELDWMKDDRLREIVFQVRENELAGRDPFYLMDAEDKLAFFEGLERKVEKENEKLLNLHEWIHSNVENIDYGADGISLYDSPEKIIPRWKGPPLDRNPEFLNNFVEQGKPLVADNSSNSYFVKKDGQDSLQNAEESLSHENIHTTSAVNNQNMKNQNGASKYPKTVIEGSDGSVRAGKKSGKEYWQHTKKWSRGFLESYNAEADPEIKAVMKDVGKDLDRWITEKEIQEAADLMNKIPEKGRKFIEKKLTKIKREMELFGPQAVVSKYQEYAEEKEEDYLWWLDLPYVLCIELYTCEKGEQKIGLYSSEMAADLELSPKQYHVIAFEEHGDCKNLCYIIQAHMEMLGNGNAFVVARPPKDVFREAKANGFSVTVIRKGELQLNVDHTLEEVEEQITEIGSKIYQDKIMSERSVDISSLMKGVFGASKPTKRRRRSKRKLKNPTKP
uniref:Embryo defective 1703 n=1 Tax=Davidia involucrata TaxID=16924 RepID=A0A5B7BT08_DAVIN